MKTQNFPEISTGLKSRAADCIKETLSWGDDSFDMEYCLAHWRYFASDVKYETKVDIEVIGITRPDIGPKSTCVQFSVGGVKVGFVPVSDSGGFLMVRL